MAKLSGPERPGKCRHGRPAKTVTNPSMTGLDVERRYQYAKRANTCGLVYYNCTAARRQDRFEVVWVRCFCCGGRKRTDRKRK